MLVSINISIDVPQLFYPVDCDGYSAKIFLHLSLQDVRSRAIQHVTILVVYPGKQNGFIDPCLVFKRDEFHEFTVDGVDRFAGNMPADGGHLLPHMGMKISGPDICESFEDILVAVEGMDRKKKAQGVHLVS
jgi:hypothetical protein